ncbi:12731_t:CDS:2 [Dentiscutata heterogama]|uniref:12731_t:CDS:1 n=1 Tax=Dentiscutata heterogama TaxID=1316150 RepID=A0ACA9KMA0_9GLOM|nr:12731_t:CDS:2 [Dentiscutata heterogama]
MAQDNNTNDQEQETHINAESSNSESGSHVWHHFEVLQDKIYAECKICRIKGKSVKYKFHGTTSNMIYHLYNEHGITKDNQTGYIEDGNIEAFMKVAREKISPRRQLEIETAMMTWMIDDCQPFYLLRNESFKTFMKIAVPGFKLPGDDKARHIINDAFTQSTDQLTKTLQDIRRHTGKNIKNTITQIIDRVSKGLNAAKAFKKRVTNLILHFNGSPKQTENLKDAQQKSDKEDAEYLERINLTNSEWSLLSDVLALLAPFYEATKMLSGVTYATLNMVCHTMHYLKKTVAPPEDEDDEYYTNLLNDELDEVASQDEDTDDEVTTSNQRLQFKNHRAISLPNSTIDVLEKIKATIYLTAIIEESNDDLYVSSSGSLVTNEPSSTSTNQVNYSLLGIYEDSDDESSISDEVARYLALPKVSPNRNVLEWWKVTTNVGYYSIRCYDTFDVTAYLFDTTICPQVSASIHVSSKFLDNLSKFKIHFNLTIWDKLI